MLTITDFLLMIAFVGVIAYFALRQKKGIRSPRIEDASLLRGGVLRVEVTPQLDPIIAPLGAEPFFFCFDTETSDFIPEIEIDDIPFFSFPPAISLSYALLDKKGRMMEQQSVHLSVRDKSISEKAEQYHGVSDLLIAKEGIDPKKAYEAFRKALDKAQVIVAHHLPAHQEIVTRDLVRYGLPAVDWRKYTPYCTLVRSKRFFIEHPAITPPVSYKLPDVYSYLYFRQKITILWQNKSYADLRLCIALLRYFIEED